MQMVFGGYLQRGSLTAFLGCGLRRNDADAAQMFLRPNSGMPYLLWGGGTEPCGAIGAMIF